jgi:Fur family ferric uptake transcriptional regulator
MSDPSTEALCPGELQRQQRLRSAGLRRTRALQAVLALFDDAPGWSPTHAQLAERLQGTGEPVNAVTLYRLLERLVSAGLLVKRTAADERAWRFHAPAATSASGPLFECDACHTQFPLAEDDASARAVAAAVRRTLARQGHQAARVDVAVHGTCADCRGVQAHL